MKKFDVDYIFYSVAGVVQIDLLQSSFVCTTCTSFVNIRYLWDKNRPDWVVVRVMRGRVHRRGAQKVLLSTQVPINCSY